LQFLGNSLIAIWSDSKPLTGDSGYSSSHKEKQEISEDDRLNGRRAIQCALDIKNERLKMPLIGEINIGLGFGECAVMHVGGVFKRVEYFLVGDSLAQALRSLHLSTSQ
jgi:hypothetical protein